jgi:glycosyltransferase involved in cell wall biosynthesis
MTGHCIYPMGCERWKIGCGQCPDLDIPFMIRQDRTHENFERKRRAYEKTSVELIVASQWMLDFVKASPLMRHFPVHVVPFGVDLERFRPRPAEEARRKLGILPGRTVLFFRASSSSFKGLPYIMAALAKLRPDRPVTILTVQETGLFEKQLGTSQVVELGWVHDEDLLADAFAACDIFLMPSTTEAFGVMAIEAMASGRPVISFEGTSLPAVTFAPECGVTVPMRDADALAAAIDRLADDTDERRRRGGLARRLAEEHYSLDRYANRLCEVYRDVEARARTPKAHS